MTAAGGIRSAAVAGVLAALVGSCVRPPAPAANGAATDSPTATPTRTAPSPTVSPETRAASEITGVFPERPEGDRIRLLVYEIEPALLRRIGPCDLHRFAGVGAYAASCVSRPELVWIHVALQNESVGEVRYDRDRFFLTDDRGRDREPVSALGILFDDKDALFPPHGAFGPQAWVSGWLVFLGGSSDAVVASVTYEDGNQEIAVTFEGRHTVDRV